MGLADGSMRNSGGPVSPDIRAERLEDRFRERSASEIIADVLVEQAAGKAAVVSSFGGESAVLLALVAEVDPGAPVIFLETGKHFPETLRHRDTLMERLGLTNVQSVKPDAERLAEGDPKGALWASDADACCAIRKVEPLARALSGFDAWITGRKRFQTAGRQQLAFVEWDGVHTKVNPLADWSRSDLTDFLTARDLPAHPLTASGFRSIGCMPCTQRVAEGEDERAGRWRGSDKTECGIHLSLTGLRAA